MPPGAPIRPGLPELRCFKDALHTDFRLDAGDGDWAELTLIEVADAPARPGWEQFSLLFSGPPAPAHWHGTVTVEHPDMGTFALFLVAVITDGDGRHYEATFHRRTT